MPSISYLQLGHYYIQLEFIQKIHLSSALFWVISRNFGFYKWFGNQTCNRLLKYYNNIRRNRRQFVRLQTDSDKGPNQRSHDRKNDWMVLLRFCDSVIFGGIANLSFIFMLKIRELMLHLSPCHLSPVHATKNQSDTNVFYARLKFNINIYINLCISSSSSGSGSYSHCVFPFRLTNFRCRVPMFCNCCFAQL